MTNEQMLDLLTRVNAHLVVHRTYTNSYDRLVEDVKEAMYDLRPRATDYAKSVLDA